MRKVIAGRCRVGLVLVFLAGDATSRSQTPSSQPPVGPLVEMAPVIVSAPKSQPMENHSEEAYWKLEQFGQGDNFHIRGGQLVDAVIFRHDYLQQHPGERAIVVVTTEPKSGRVTQAVVAYTAGAALHIASHAVGDVTARGLTALDIAHPDAVRKFVRQLRVAYLHASGGDGLATLGAIMALAEESGNYSMAGQLYDGTSADMLKSAYHWLSNREKAGLIPVSQGKVTVKVPQVDGTGKAIGMRTERQDAVVFDWDGYHYLYNDGDGMLAKALPKNPVTGVPCLILKDGDVFESLYFVATYTRQRPGESAVFLPALDGLHAAAAFTSGGRLFIVSPFLGRFSLPPKYRIDQISELAKLHAALVAKSRDKLAVSKLARLPTAMPQEMPGDTEVEQVRRAYLAFSDLGLPIKMIESKTMVPGFELSYAGTNWTYLAPGFQGSETLSAFSAGEGSL